MGMFGTVAPTVSGNWQHRGIPQEPFAQRTINGPPIRPQGVPQMPRTMSGPGPSPTPQGGFSPSNLGGGGVPGAPANLTSDGAFGPNPNDTLAGGGGMMGSSLAGPKFSGTVPRATVHALGRTRTGASGGVNPGAPQQPAFQPAPAQPAFNPNDPNNAALAGYMSR